MGGRTGELVSMIGMFAGLALMAVPGTHLLGIPLLAWRVGAMAVMIAGGIITAGERPKTSFSIDGQVRGLTINTRSTAESIPVVYGEARVGGNQVFVAVTGANNEYLHIIQTISEGEIQGVQEVWLDDKLSTDAHYAGLVHYEIFTGTQTQSVCSTLQSAYPEWQDTLRGTAYIYLRLLYKDDKYQGIPQITTLTRGRKLYDPRSGQTVWSRNGALVAYDMMTNPIYGFGLPADVIDIASICDAANRCDSLGYFWDGRISDRDTAADVFEQILSCFRGYLTYLEGVYRLKIYDYDSPVLTLTDDDIIEDSFELIVPGLPETPNRLRVRYFDMEQRYALHDLIIEDREAITIDGMEREEELFFIGIRDCNQASKIATYQLERKRLNKTYNVTVGSRGYALELGDTVSCTFGAVGWTNQLARVVAIEYLPSYEVALSLVEETPALYDTVLNVSPHTYHTGTFVDPLTVPPSVGNVQITEEVIADRERTFSRLLITFDRPEWAWWDHAEAWISLDGNDYRFYVSTQDKFSLDYVETGQTYYIKLLSVSIYGVKQRLEDVTNCNRTAHGKLLPPGNVTSLVAIASGDAINLRWEPVHDIDLAGYEIRVGPSWHAGLMIARTQAVTYTMQGVKPGQHNFHIKAVDTQGNYSVSAASAQCIVFYPANYSDKASFNDTFQGGIHNNTSYYTDAAYGVVLHVGHYSAAMMGVYPPRITGQDGDYLSPVYDLGTARNIRLWAQFGFVIIGDETTWQGRYMGMTWSAHNMSWNQIFSPLTSGGLSMELIHSADGVNWHTVPYFHIYSPEVNCRWMRYKTILRDVSPQNYIMQQSVMIKAAYWN